MSAKHGDQIDIPQGESVSWRDRPARIWSFRRWWPISRAKCNSESFAKESEFMSHRTPSDYATKFKGFIQLCAETIPNDAVVVASPSVLGDTYDELIESLSRLAKAKLALRIVEPQ